MMFLVKLFLTFALVIVVASSNGQTEEQGNSVLSSLAQSSNDFGFQLTSQFSGQDNFFISPLSIYLALSLVYMGSAGQTAQQFESSFHLNEVGLVGERLHAAVKEYHAILASGSNEYSLLLANGLFAQQNFTLKQNYIRNAQDYYSSSVRLVDFLSNGEVAKDEINKWVATNTNNKLQNFLAEPLDPQTVLALLNAIYFKGLWKTQFNEQYTLDGHFYKNDGSSKSTKFMIHREAHFRFLNDRTTNYQFLELPYKGDHISMLLALPSAYEEQPNLQMTSTLLRRINESMSRTKLQTVLIPKFKMEYRKDLKGDLGKLGLSNIFTSSVNLSAMRQERDIFVSSVKHAAIIEVNEQGSEAAAVTGVFITRLSAVSFDPEFIANHPFLFYIIDNRSGLVLFSGRMSDP